LAPVDEAAPGRLPDLRPVGVVDIGSNSVRLVVYEGLVRSATPVFNEKVLCGLGRHVATRALLDEDAIEEALQALTRYRAICEHIGTEFVHVVATAAVREAQNGPDFVARATAVMGVDIKVLTGAEEARLCGYGVLSGMYRPDGLAADMGGGSLEIVDVHGAIPGEGVSLPLGGLNLRDLAGGSMKKSRGLVSETLDTTALPARGQGRDLYAIGGTFRALGRLHMAQTGYPLHVMHGYGLATDEALDFCRLVARVKPDSLDSVDVVAPARRALLPHGAVVLAELLERASPRGLVISAFGVREGLLHTLLPEHERNLDPLLSSCAALAYLRSRSPRHAHELCTWTDQLMTSAGLEETEEERRLRHSACLLADIGWRAHPDYRGEQTLNLIAHAAFSGIDHQGRAYLALSVYYRHAGLKEEHLSPRIRELASARTLDRARVLGAALRVAYLVSAAMPGLIDRAPLVVEGGVVVLRLPGPLKQLAGERLARRLKQFGKLLGRKSAIELAG
jgi:exopolyphosphatase / guanosine-5'-triphosphate,3'-diphosphate pyrophosphatase